MKSLNKGRRSAFAVMLAVVLAALVTGGCRKKEGGAGGGGGQGGKMRVGFSQTETDGPWRIAETKSMQDEAAKRGYELVFTNARGDTAAQVSNLEDVVAQRVDAIFLAPREAKGYEGPLQAAKEAGIPVFLIDRELEGPKAGDDYATFIGSNFIEEGKRAGEWLAQQTRGQGGHIEPLRTPGSSGAHEPPPGLAHAPNGLPPTEVLAPPDCQLTRAPGRSL